MGGDQIMMAIGVGCRKDCPPASIVAVVQAALAQVKAEPDRAIFTHDAKAGEPGLHQAAATLGLTLTFLPNDSLRAVDHRVETRSARVQAMFGVGSVAEAAALCGAGPEATLILRRIARDGATCAVALS